MIPVIAGCISDLSNYFNGIKRVSSQCDKLHLFLNPTKTEEMKEINQTR